MNPSGLPICGNCQQTIPADSPSGVCPRCVFAAAMATPLGERQQGHPHIATTQFDPQRGRHFVPPTPQELNGRFKDLQVEALIGHGGMGAVYRARQKQLDRVVALKILSSSLGSDPTFVERFAREAKTLAKLTHANIVMVFEFGTIDEMCYLVMEYVDGINLRDAIRNKTISPDQALKVVPQICEALQYAHDEGVVHRDIKPENILLNNRGQVKIADFGLAKILDADSNDISLTGTHQIMGTRNYMAPEQIEKPLTVDHRADIYSLGVVFYELLTGELPIGRFANPSEKVQINSQLDHVVMKTLEKEPDRRFQQASEIRTAVHEIERFEANQTRQAAAHEKVPHAAQTNVYSNQPMVAKPICSVPFTIGDLHGGLTCAHGLMLFFEHGLTLEYEVKDEVFGSTVKEPTSVTIPLDKITAVELKKGMFGRSITVFTNSVISTKNVPGAQQGSFKVKIASGAAELAEELVKELKKSIAKYKANPFNFSASPAPVPTIATATPVKAIHDTKSESASADAIKRLENPAGYLKLVAILNIVFNATSILSLLGKSFKNPIRDWSIADRFSGWNPDAAIKDNVLDLFSGLVKISFSPLQQFTGSLISFVIGILILVAVSNMKQLRNYPLCVALICVALLPIYDLYVFGFCFAVWALVVLLDPHVKSQFQQPDDIQPLAFETAKKPQQVQDENKNGNLLKAILLFFGIGIAFVIVLVTAFSMLLWSHTIETDRKPMEVPGNLATQTLEITNESEVQLPKATGSSETTQEESKPDQIDE